MCESLSSLTLEGERDQVLMNRNWNHGRAYFANLALGTPPVNFLVLLDTGSAVRTTLHVCSVGEAER